MKHLVTITLEEWEWDIVEAEAAALGISVPDLLHEMIEEAQLELSEQPEAIRLVH